MHKRLGISFLAFKQVYAKTFEKMYEIIELKPKDTNKGFCPVRSITDQIFTPQQTF